VLASDQDAGDTREYTLTGADAGLFNLDAATGAVSIAENIAAVTTVAASDVDASTTIAYSLNGGADAGKFSINATTGALTFITAPDFDAPGDSNGDNIYEVIVRASDGALSDTQTLSVTITGVNEAPVITSNPTDAISVAENGTAVTTVLASDQDAGDTREYSISGADALLFNIDATTGVLTFVGAPNFEAPADAGADGVYNITVTAEDDGLLIDTQNLAITVTNVNEAPTITSDGGGATGAVSIAENIAAVTTVAASDVDASTTIAYSIIGGADAGKFSINATTGALTFITAPDFDAPGDLNGDNIYEVIVRASDGALSDTQTISVTVTDTFDNVFGTAGNDTIVANAAGGNYFGLAGNDTITGSAVGDSIDGGADNDTIDGGAGDDTLSGGLGADIITDLLSTSGIATINGGDGDDEITISTALTSGTINGGAGSDQLNRAGSLGALVFSNLEILNTGGLAVTATAAQMEAFDTIRVNALNSAATVSLTLAAAGTIDLSGELLGRGVSFTGTAGADTITTSNGADTITGGLGGDTIDAGAGIDIISGGDGIDTLIGGGDGDTLDGGNDIDFLTGGAGIDTQSGGGGNDRFFVNAAGESGAGEAYDGGAGVDELWVAGAGAHSFVGVTFASIEWLVVSSATATFDAEDVGAGLASNLFINALNASSSISFVRSSAGATTLAGLQFFDIDGSTITLTGTGGIDTLTGSSWHDTINGGGGADIIDGGLNTDAMVGGAGDDTYYVDEALDVVTEVAGEGSDTVNSTAASYTLGSEVDNLVLLGASVSGTGNTGANAITGNALANTLSGGDGADTLLGGAGADSLSGDGGADELVGGADADALSGGLGVDLANYAASAAGIAVNLLLGTGVGGDSQGDTLTGVENVRGSALADTLTGNASANALEGGDGDDLLAGLGGADALTGGAGIDTADYSASAGGVTVNLATGAGIGSDAQGDTLSGIEYAIGSGFGDNLTGSSIANILQGGAGNDALAGGDGNDILVGGAGADSLGGGVGTDTVDYSSSSAAVTINLASGPGVGGDAQGDTLFSIEVATGSAFADTLSGRDFVTDTLNGGDGDDVLMGRYGGDVLNGGAGTDTLSYANSLTGVDVRLFNGLAVGGEANGDVFTSIENLTGSSRNDTLSGDDNVNVLSGGGNGDALTGRGGADLLYGEAGGDVLLGGGGDDFLVGGAGADTLGGGAGNDTADYSASAAAVNVNLASGVGTGGDAQGDGLVSIENVIGSGFNDTIVGKANVWDNIFNGGAGADTMTGGLGNDTFVFHAGQANGDLVLDFTSAAINDNDTLMFFGYGTAIAGANLVQLDATHWQINSADGTIHDVITLANGEVLDASDYIFG
jgi:Ca2+-binding RTX toxin-like protein